MPPPERLVRAASLFMHFERAAARGRPNICSVADNKIAVLISGRGSNMLALQRACADGRLPAQIALVLSNDPSAAGLTGAQEQGLHTEVLEPREFPNRIAYEQALGDRIEVAGAELICLAGFMRRLGAGIVKRFAGRILNIHPSLLPAFPGLEGQHQAWEHGVRYTGCTVHFVDEQLDHGPIILQQVVEVKGDDDPDELAARILEREHDTYWRAVKLYFERRLEVQGRRVIILPEARGRSKQVR